MLSHAVAVGHPLSNEPESLPDVRSTDARSRDTGCPEGVTDSFHVSLYKVEPAMSNRCFNLLTKDDVRLALCDEVVEGWPKVPLVSKPKASACTAERLAGCGPCPHRPVVGPSCKSQGCRPATKACKEVALAIPGEVTGLNVSDVSFIYISWGDEARFN